MKKVHYTLISLLTLFSSLLYAGGDIRPAEAAVEPAVRASSGDALSLVSMLVLMTLTMAVGLYFLKKERTA